MELHLKRNVRTPSSTIGVLSVDGKRQCFVLEDTDRGLKQTMPLEEIKRQKIYGNTAIPAGRYQVVMTFSDHFKKYLPLLMNVPGYEGVRIHSGNVPADTLGCLLVGNEKGVNTVGNSRDALADLLKIITAVEKKEKIYITIE